MFGFGNFKTLAAAAVSAAAFLGAGSFASAATVGPAELGLDSGFILSGEYSEVNDSGCPSDGGKNVSKPCVKLNNTQSGLTLSYTGSLAFDLFSFWYKFEGKSSSDNALQVSYILDDLTVGVLSLFTEAINCSQSGPNDGMCQAVVNLTGLKSVTFTDMNGGTTLVDTFDAAKVSDVPVPAAGFLLMGALGGLAALRRRRRVA